MTTETCTHHYICHESGIGITKMKCRKCGNEKEIMHLDGKDHQNKTVFKAICDSWHGTRQELADKLGMKYSTLNYKINKWKIKGI